MTDRQETQAARSRVLRDPEAGQDTIIVDGAPEIITPTSPSDTAESVQADAEVGDFLPPEVEVTATIIDEGIIIQFLVPHALIGVALSDDGTTG